MRLTNVDLYASNFSEPISFNLRDIDPKSQYLIRAVMGLDAEEIIAKFYGFGLNKKPRFYDFGLKARDIVIRAVLNPRFELDESYSDIRDELYRAISATRTGMIALHFKSGATIVARIDGYITKFEVPYFAQLPEVQITIRCDDPMFRAINPVIFEPAELSLTNPIIIPDSLSTAPHGFSMDVDFTAPSASFTIQDVATSPEWKFKVIPSGGFLTGDKLCICSEFSKKHLYLLRAGVYTHLMDKIEPDSIWPILFPGANEFHFVDLASVTWDSLEYHAAYWGV